MFFLLCLYLCLCPCVIGTSLWLLVDEEEGIVGSVLEWESGWEWEGEFLEGREAGLGEEVAGVDGLVAASEARVGEGGEEGGGG